MADDAWKTRDANPIDTSGITVFRVHAILYILLLPEQDLRDLNCLNLNHIVYQ